MPSPYKQFTQSTDVIIRDNQPVQYLWSFSNAGVGTDGSGDKWTNSTMSAYVCHAVASASDISVVKNSFGGTFDGNITSQDLFWALGTQFFGMTNNTSSITYGNWSNITKMYVLMLDKDLVLDKIKSDTFALTLSGQLATSCSAQYTFVLKNNTNTYYPDYTTIRYADSHGALSSTNVGMAFLNEGIFCFLGKGDESGASGLLTQLFGNVATPLTNSNLQNAFTAAGKGIIQTLSANSVEYQDSLIYFCRAHNNEFNHSLNPTFGVTATIQGTKIGYVMRDEFINDNESNSNTTVYNPKVYMTGVGLYDDNANLLATAKLNAPRLKDFYSEALFKVKITL